MWNVLAPVVGVVVASLFSRLVVQGYLTPEQASSFQKWLMDGLALGVPVLIAAYLGSRGTQAALITATDALPGVKGVAVTQELASKIDSQTVTTLAKLPEAVRDAA